MLPVSGPCMLRTSRMAFLQLLQITPASASEEEAQEEDQSHLPANHK